MKKQAKVLARMTAVAMLAATAAATSAAQNPEGKEATTNGVSTVLAATTTVVRLGDPIRVSLRVKNRSDGETTFDRSDTAFDCFEVRDLEGQPAPYVGFMGQVMSDALPVPPSATVTVVEGLDLTDKYLFRKLGRYTIRFKGTPSSNRITVEVTPGQLGELDQVVAQLLPICPEGWSVMKSRRGEEETAPFGRARVPGYDAHLYRSFMGGEAVYLWLTKTKAPLAAGGRTEKSDYLGYTGRFHAYVAPGPKATATWPKALEDISRVLRITHR